MQLPLAATVIPQQANESVGAAMKNCRKRLRENVDRRALGVRPSTFAEQKGAPAPIEGMAEDEL